MYAKNGIGDVRLPIVKRRFLEPHPAAKRGGDPIASLKHFASDLGISRLIGADQPEAAQPIKEKEQAETCQN